jgi:hypothetical protein
MKGVGGDTGLRSGPTLVCPELIGRDAEVGLVDGALDRRGRSRGAPRPSRHDDRIRPDRPAQRLPLSGGEGVTCDAVEFCRILSGRATGTGLLAQPVPF